MPAWEPFDERERVRIVRSLYEEHPNLDLENSLGGALAGPASPDRPDVPVWDFLAIVQADGSVSLADLSAVRFPVLHFGGESSVTSIDEELRPPPAHLKVTPPASPYVIDASAIVRRYVMERNAGMVEWDPYCSMRSPSTEPDLDQSYKPASPSSTNRPVTRHALVVVRG